MVPPGLKSPERTQWAQAETKPVLKLPQQCFQPSFLNLALRIPGKGSKIQIPRPNLMHQEARIHIKNNKQTKTFSR